MTLRKPRMESVEYRVRQSFRCRANLPRKERDSLLNLVKGFQGEKQFDSIFEKHCPNGILLPDLFLKENNTEFQVDAIWFDGEGIRLYEIKNYRGNYFYQNGSFHLESGMEILSPVEQADKNRILLANLIRKLGRPLPIKHYAVFVHPDFQLYNFPSSEPILTLNQLPRHFQSVVNPAAPPNHMALADKLIDLHDPEYRPKNLPDYPFEELKKGILCPKCFSFGYADTRENRICTQCGYKETINHAILRSAEEFWVLYPDTVLTTGILVIWCGGDYPPQRVQRVLDSTCIAVGHKKGRHYVRNPRNMLRI